MNAPHSLLVLAIGNPDRGDDAAAWEIANAMDGLLPEGATLMRQSGDLLSMLDQWQQFDAMICIDAAAPQGRPGHISRFDLATGPLPTGLDALSSHAFGLGQCIALAERLGSAPARIIVYAIEGESFAVGEPLSHRIAAAVTPASKAVLSEATRLLEGKVDA
uniref:hydrogenase maturation protease n=1 Tax=Parerythrobacter lutipelagi TaxID=1964208 RepID=UPI0010F7BC12|nr:hydrogenase maturation protease [Parerythrobacter lutipelagi]